jgi:hypothetical protein
MAAEREKAGEVVWVSVDMLNHIAAHYIPVIASVGADRGGNSYTFNGGTAAGKAPPRSRPTIRSAESTRHTSSTCAGRKAGCLSSAGTGIGPTVTT